MPTSTRAAPRRPSPRPSTHFTTKFIERGLGLAATPDIFRAHHGAVFIESAPGKGSTLRALLPAGAARLAEEILMSAPGAESVQFPGSATDLLVDDEEGLRSVLRDVLEFSGFKVVEARNDREAMKACSERAEPSRLGLMGVTTRDMNGVETSGGLHRL